MVPPSQRSPAAPLAVPRARVGPPPLPARATAPSHPEPSLEDQAIELSDEELVAEEAERAPVSSAQGAPTILIVDDDAAMRALLVSVLGAQYTVYAAATGTEAIGMFDWLRPDLVLSDVELPGADGYEVAAALKRNPHTKGVPLAFLTAHGSSFDLIRGINAGARQYLTKPFRPEELLARIAHMLER